MSTARLVITAVIVEGRTPTEVSHAYGVSRSWIYELLARYRTEGDAALEPRSRRPRSSPHATPTATIDMIIGLRRQLASDGLDAGAATIAWHLAHHHRITISTRTIHRILTAQGLVTPDPTKRPRSSLTRFQAALPNECWQADFTHVRLASGRDVEVLCFIDDHARYAISVTAHRRVTGPIVIREFTQAVATHGPPASTLTDNGMVFTTRLSGGKGGRNGFEKLLEHLSIRQKNSRPNHPTTCGKVERFHATLKAFLAARPPSATISELQALLDRFVHIYNHERPHRAHPQRATPATIYTARPKATPGPLTPAPHRRVRTDVIGDGGTITIRHAGRLHHIGIGRTHARTRVLVLIDDLDIRVINAATGELYRHLTLDPTRNYQPTGRPPGPPPRKPNKPEP